VISMPAAVTEPSPMARSEEEGVRGEDGAPAEADGGRGGSSEEASAG
jgi:hypothetical protein